MGSGKTTIGALLAKELGWPFVDLDATLEAGQGMTIRQIFEQSGEVFFREIERAALTEHVVVLEEQRGHHLCEREGAQCEVQAAQPQRGERDERPDERRKPDRGHEPEDGVATGHLAHRERADADVAIATSGVAGPDGGTAEHPVGTVCIALVGDGKRAARRGGPTAASASRTDHWQASQSFSRAASIEHAAAAVTVAFSIDDAPSVRR